MKTPPVKILMKKKQALPLCVLPARWHRKGQSDDDQSAIILYAVLFIAGALIVFLVFKAVQDASTNQFEDSACRLSVGYAAGLRLTQIDAFAANIKCPTKRAVISTQDTFATNTQIAQAMTGCWKNWWQGKQNLFKDDGIYCNVCSVLTFKPKTGTIDGLEHFLATQYPARSNMTYADYLMAFQTSEAGKFAPAIKEFPLTSLTRDQSYAVIFVHARGSDTVKTFMTKLTALGSGGTAIAGGSLIAVGAVSAAGGVVAVITSPLWATAAAAGAVIALVGGGIVYVSTGTSLFSSPPEYASQILFVKYTPEVIGEIGCQNSPG